MAVKAIPDAYAGGVPSLCVDKGYEALELYTKVFGAEVTLRFDQPDGRLGHAELKIGRALFSLSDEFPEYGTISPKTLGGTPVKMHIYMEDVDAVVERALAAGMTLLRPVSNEFYGDRVGQLADPFGHVWSIATHIEDVTAEEMYRRAAKLFGSTSG
ncbi:MAG: glyoxalase/bleomycin resistance protein/dioxygenase [Hyphomicrobiales bacterium]|nr:glyoxalase/bleomycin resistance protein/dioxygenase [Hyphomicrobiales bacterium]